MTFQVGVEFLLLSLKYTHFCETSQLWYLQMPRVALDSVVSVSSEHPVSQISGSLTEGVWDLFR